MNGHEAIEERIVRAELEVEPPTGGHQEGRDDEVAVAEALAPQIRLRLHASEELGEANKVVGGGDDEQPRPVGHELMLAQDLEAEVLLQLPHPGLHEGLGLPCQMHPMGEVGTNA